MSDPFLLTPGPLTTSSATKEAMLHDWGSRDLEFIRMNARVRDRLLDLAGGRGSHVCVPLQGSGTFVVEAMVGTLVPPGGKAARAGQRRLRASHGPDLRVLPARRRGARDPRGHAGRPVPPSTPRSAPTPRSATSLVVHCETTSGVLNPVAEVAAVTARRSRRLLVDAMSAFGAIPLDAARVPYDALVASSNKCLEGVPGVGFAIVRQAALEEAAGQAPSLSLDLHDQWVVMEKTGQWRFTPPTHVIAALDQAIAEHAAEGGVAGRGGRYARNCRLLVDGLRALGFRTLLPDDRQAPIIVTVHMPGDRALRVRRLLRRAGAARLRHLPRQAHRGRQLPHRLHRAAGRGGDAGRPRRDPGDPGRHGRDRLRSGLTALAPVGEPP